MDNLIYGLVSGAVFWNYLIDNLVEYIFSLNAFFYE